MFVVLATTFAESSGILRFLLWGTLNELHIFAKNRLHFNLICFAKSMYFFVRKFEVVFIQYFQVLIHLFKDKTGTIKCLIYDEFILQLEEKPRDCFIRF